MPVGRRFQYGVTLVELLATLTVSAALTTLAAPSFYTMIRNNQLTVQANEVTTVLTLARTEARKRGQLVVVCKSSDGNSCSTLSSVQWEDGWMVYVDADRDRAFNAGEDDDEPILASSTGLPGESTLRADADFSSYIAFLPDGRCVGNGNAQPPADGTFRICDSRGADYAREIDVSPTGRTSVRRVLGTAHCP